MASNQTFEQKVFKRTGGAGIEQLAMRRTRRIHFVGIGGAGMGGIAEVLLRQGFEISGSDIASNSMTERLERLGATIFACHKPEHVDGADVVVQSTAIDSKNPEIIHANRKLIPVVRRAEMLAELMRFRYGIAVAGTHGKTTTTSLTASILAQGGLDPTFVIGGLLNSAGANAKLGASPYLVAEADESDGSFMLLSPMVAIITNIDKDHLGTYDNNFETLKQTFIDFAHKLPFYGLVVACIDCPIVREILPDIGRPLLTYGFSEDADFRITGFAQTGTRTTFSVESKRLESPLACELNLPGKHNALNATASFIVALEEGVGADAATVALREFSGIGRRFEVYQQGVSSNTILVDDYGHHPAEIKATIDAARLAWPDKKIMMAFQPHRYTRTHDLFEDFVEVLSRVDTLFLLEVYSAGEKPIPGADGRALSGAIRARGQCAPIFVPSHEKLLDLVTPHLTADSVLITQGAGDIGKLSSELLQGIQRLAS